MFVLITLILLSKDALVRDCQNKTMPAHDAPSRQGGLARSVRVAALPSSSHACHMSRWHLAALLHGAVVVWLRAAPTTHASHTHATSTHGARARAAAFTPSPNPPLPPPPPTVRLGRRARTEAAAKRPKRDTTRVTTRATAAAHLGIANDSTISGELSLDRESLTYGRTNVRTCCATCERRQWCRRRARC